MSSERAMGQNEERAEEVGAKKARLLSLPPAAHYALTAFGILALLFFCGMLWSIRWGGYSDFDQIYMAGLAWRNGIPPYGEVQPAFSAPDGPDSKIFHYNYYPPLLSMLAAPLSLLPFPTAALVWNLLMFSVLFSGIWRFCRLLFPDWPVSAHWFLLGVTALSSAVRWNLVQFQPTALIVGLLFHFACAVITQQWRGVLALGIVLTVKPNFFLPVLGLLLFRRRLALLVALLAVAAALNFVSILQTGPRATYAAYKLRINALGKPGAMAGGGALMVLTPYINLTPTSPLRENPNWRGGYKHWADPNINVEFILSAWFPGFRRGSLVAAALGLIPLAMIARVYWRTRGSPRQEDPYFLALLFAALTGLALLIMYHQRYDALALLPAIYVALATLRQRRKDYAAWLTLAAGILFAYLLNVHILHLFLRYVVVPRGWLILTPIAAYLTLAVFLGTLAILWRYRREPASETGLERA